ncbi:MFS transporter [Plantactinospora sp. ZYX-F-223]|uniref:MFS transporter n=1 Tax=Plantactinospora sp. ZYX-F-223 TaxID=3144103 RepID=UPI0031FC30CF
MNLPHRSLAVIAATNLAQLPIALRQLLVVLLGHDNSGSYAVAGAAGAACGVGLAISAPLAGRLLTRLGHRRVLLGFGMLHASALIGLSFAATPAGCLTLAAVAGLATPPVTSSSRAILPALVPASALSRAYALNAVGQEVLYVAGPLAVTVILGYVGPAAALLAFTAVGTIALLLDAAIIPPFGSRAEPAAPARTGPARVAVLTLVGVHFAYMVGMGAMWVLLPAFATDNGRPNQTGLLIAVWSAASLVGGLLLVKRGRSGGVVVSYLALLAALALTSGTLLLPRTVPQMGLALLAFGLALAPWLATTDELMVRTVPPHRSAESYGWQQTAGQLGLAAGSASSGLVNDHIGTRAAFLVVSTTLLAGFAVAYRQRAVLQAAAEGERYRPSHPDLQGAPS